jgi:hypothetical protein
MGEGGDECGKHVQGLARPLHPGPLPHKWGRGSVALPSMAMHATSTSAGLSGVLGGVGATGCLARAKP